MTMTLGERAERVLGVKGSRIVWPYGMETPRRDRLAGMTPEDAAETLQHAVQRQETLIAWAERYDLRAARRGCCPLWLGRKVSRSCGYGRRFPCTRWGSADIPDRKWLDHGIGWVKDRRPVALTGAPYSVSARDEERFGHWLRMNPELRIARGTGWYGYDTTQIVMWRADRIGPMEAA